MSCRRIGSKLEQVDGRNFAFTRCNDLTVGVKSEREDDDPYGLNCDSVPDTFPILTNPNKCHIDWYTTNGHQDIPESNEEIFFPTTGYTQYGSYAQHDGIPGTMYHDGDMVKMTSANSYEYYKGDGVKLLFVDCQESVKSMYKFKLRKINFNSPPLESNETMVSHFSERFKNEDSREKFGKVKRSVEITNFAHFIFESDFDFHSVLKWELPEIQKIVQNLQFENESERLPLFLKNNNSSRILIIRNSKTFVSEGNVKLPVDTVVDVSIRSVRTMKRIPFSSVFELIPRQSGRQFNNTGNVGNQFRKIQCHASFFS